MSKLRDAIGYLHEIDIESERRRKVSEVSTVSIFLVTFLYLCILVSYDKYDMIGILGMGIYLIAISIAEDISLLKGLRKTKYIILLLFFVGIANPFIDREVICRINNIPVSGGMISFITLFVKGIFALLACYLMIIRIGMQGLAEAMKKLRIPNVIINTFLLIHRYIIVFMKEIDKMTQAYSMRANGKKGIDIKSWGSFAGLILIRSVDRANEVYKSMLLRGYEEERPVVISNIKYSFMYSLLYLILWIGVFILLRFYNIFEILGNGLLNR